MYCVYPNGVRFTKEELTSFRELYQKIKQAMADLVNEIVRAWRSLCEAIKEIMRQEEIHEYLRDKHPKAYREWQFDTYLDHQVLDRRPMNITARNRC